MSEDEKKVAPKPEEGEDKTKENEVKGDDKDVKSLEAQKEHFRAKAEKLQAELDAARASKPEKVEEPKVESSSKSTNDYDSRFERIEFAQAHPDLGAETVQEILDLAKSKGITPKEALELPMAKAYLDSVKAERAVVEATPTSGRSPKASSPKPISEMSEEEHKAYHQSLVGKR